MRRAMVLGCCFTLLLVSSCASEDDGSTPEPTVTVAASPTPEPTPCVLEDATIEGKELDDPDARRGTVTDIRQSDDGGCARVVFEFKDQVPSYSVGYADPPFADCGSGEEADTSAWGAKAFLKVRLTPAGAGDVDTGEPTYRGPNDIAVDGGTLKHMRRTCDFEAVYEWVLGVDGELPFVVSTFDEPSRIVIDISER